LEIAKNNINKNYHLGDIINTLSIQRDISEKKYTQYVDFYTLTSSKHFARATLFLKELKQERDEIVSDNSEYN
jgi:hypothetical protein